MPLHLQYESGKANSVLNWLERWSASQFWKPVTQTKEVQQKPPLENVDSVSARSSEFEYTRRIMRKYSIPSAYFVNEEDPHHELEKVKRSLRKVHNPIVESTIQSEIENERLRHSLRNDLSTGQDASELMVKDVTEVKLPDIKRTLKPLPVNGACYMVKDDQIASKMDPLWNIEEDGRVPVKNEELTREGDLTSNETKKLGRRSWFQAKQGVTENQLRSRSILPSYMAVTESAKAKLRAQSSPTSCQDAFEKHITRHNSANVEGGNKSPLSSGNGNVKVNQVEWRR